MIYTLGNSHCNLFTNSHPGNSSIVTVDNFTSCPIGPCIAYHFRDHHYSKILSILENCNIDKGEDYVMLVVGEVDCRWHLPLRIQENPENKDLIIEECVDRFFNNYLDLSDMGYRVISWGVHPSTTAGHNDDLDSPVFGDCRYRNDISKTWNDYIQLKCNDVNIPFLSIFDKLVDVDGLTNMDYFMDYCHLDYSKVVNLLKEQFEKII